MRRTILTHVILPLAAVIAIGVPAVIAATSSDDVRPVKPEAVNEQLSVANPSAGNVLPEPPLRVPVDSEVPLRFLKAQAVDVADPPNVDFTLPLPGDGVSVKSALLADAPPVTTGESVAFGVPFVGSYEFGGSTYTVRVLVPSKAARRVPLLLGERTIGAVHRIDVFGTGPHTAAVANGKSVIAVQGGSDDGQRLKFLESMRFKAPSSAG